MKGSKPEPDDLVGLVRLRQHCTFTWRKTAGQDQRRAEVLGSHCADCIEELRRRGYDLVFTDPGSPS